MDRARWQVPTGVATAAMATSMVSLYAVSALAPFLVADLGLSRAEVGGLVTVTFAVAAAVSLVAGRLVDSRGARTGLLLLAGVVGTALLAASFAGSYAWLAGALAIAGVAQALANPATNVLVARQVPESPEPPSQSPPDELSPSEPPRDRRRTGLRRRSASTVSSGVARASHIPRSDSSVYPAPATHMAWTDPSTTSAWVAPWTYPSCRPPAADPVHPVYSVLSSTVTDVHGAVTVVSTDDRSSNIPYAGTP